MTNNKKKCWGFKIKMFKLFILNFDVNFNYKQIDKKREETNISVDVNMRASIVMKKLKPRHK